MKYFSKSIETTYINKLQIINNISQQFEPVSLHLIWILYASATFMYRECNAT